MFELVFLSFFFIWLLILEEEWHIIWFWAGQIVKVLFFSGFMNTHLIGSASNWMLATPFFLFWLCTRFFLYLFLNFNTEIWMLGNNNLKFCGLSFGISFAGFLWMSCWVWQWAYYLKGILCSRLIGYLWVAWFWVRVS